MGVGKMGVGEMASNLEKDLKRIEEVESSCMVREK